MLTRLRRNKRIILFLLLPQISHRRKSHISPAIYHLILNPIIQLLLRNLLTLLPTLPHIRQLQLRLQTVQKLRLQALPRRTPFFRVHNQHTLQQIESRRGDFLKILLQRARLPLLQHDTEQLRLLIPLLPLILKRDPQNFELNQNLLQLAFPREQRLQIIKLRHNAAQTEHVGLLVNLFEFQQALGRPVSSEKPLLKKIIQLQLIVIAAKIADFAGVLADNNVLRGQKIAGDPIFMQ